MASSRPPSDVLAAWLAAQRWFAGKSHRIEAVTIDEEIPFGVARLAFAGVRLDDGTTARYALPLEQGPAVVDALDDPRFARALLDLVARAGRVAGAAGELHGHATRAFPADLPAELPVQRVGGEQSNTSVTFGDRLILKHFRRLREGVNPDQEIGEFLTERTAFRNTPRLAGHVEYVDHAGPSTTIAILQELVPGARDGWAWMLGQLAAFHRHAREAGGRPDANRVRALAPALFHALRRLGERTAELHVALASDAGVPAFAPEPITAADVADWGAAAQRQLEAARRILGERVLPTLPDVASALAPLRGRQKIRHHGDYHLGQTLWVEAREDFMIIDFEGEPLRSLAERRQKHAAVRDVAGMLRSIDYAAETSRVEAGAEAEGWASAWKAAAADDFLAGYRAAAGAAPFLPESDAAFMSAVAAFELEKAAYEVVYEADNRPDWLWIPTRGLLRACARLQPPAAGAA